MGLLYHLVPRQAWADCQARGEPYFPPTYAQDGFVHLTANPATLLPIANHFYRAVPGDFVVLAIEPDRLKAPVKFEPAAAVGGKEAHTSDTAQLFPHLYGTIDFDAVREELAVQRDDAGQFLSIDTR
eukprot:EG_transcript_31411